MKNVMINLKQARQMKLWESNKGLWIKSFLINFCVLFVFLMFFEPTTKSDDYDMVNLLCGGVNGKNSPYLMYSHYFFGLALKILTNAFPTISWFFVSQYILLYIAFSVLCYVILKINKGKQIWLFLFFMLYAGYEFYIRITFSKTSGILIAVGYLWILYLIEYQQKICLDYVWGIGLVIMGILIRGGMFQIITVVFFSTFIIFCLNRFRCKANRRDMLKKAGIFVSCVCFLYLIYNLIGIVNLKAYSLDESWDDYFEVNTIKTELFDYGAPEYQMYEEEYDQIGISQNDYRMWFSLFNRGDGEILTPGKMERIVEIDVGNEEDIKEKIIDGLRGLLKYQFENPMFFLLFSCAIILIFCRQKGIIQILFLVEGLCIFSYIYMYAMGRIQHHVDAALYATAAMIILYYCKISDNVIISKKKILLPLSIVFIVAIMLFHNQIISSSYYGSSFGNIKSQKVQYKENYKRLDLLSDDKEHFYMIGAKETNLIYPCFTLFEPIEKSFYSNIYRTNMNHIEVFESQLQEYGITNPWREYVNSDKIYYVVSKNNLSDLSIILTYIQENYNSEALCSLVKQVDDMYIYKFYSGDIVLEQNNMKAPNEDIKYNIEINITEDNAIILSGFVFEDETDSFAQNVYIEAEDIETGSSSYSMTLQTQNQELYSVGKMNGEYSAFGAEVYWENLDLNDINLYLILENENGLYRIPIE